MTSGPPLSWSGPAGVRGVILRTGLANASLAGPVQNPTAGPSFAQKPWPAMARVPLAFQRGGPKGRVYGISPGAPVQNPVPPGIGPVFYQAVQPCRARIPQNTQNTSERVGFTPGAPVRNPSQGPLFRQAVQAVRARLPLQPLLRGRCYSSPGAPVVNPAQGPVFRQKPVPVRYVLPPWQPRAGRIGSSFGAPVINPVRGPAFTQATQPCRSRLPLPLRGRVASNPGIPVQVTPPPAPPALAGRNQAVRAPLPPLGTANSFGRAATMVAIPAPVNPAAGPVFRQQPRPVKAQRPLPPRGTTASNAGGPVQNPVPGVQGPVFYPFRQAVRIRPVLPPRGRMAGTPGAPVRNPSQGPLFRQAAQPCRAPIPQNAPRGRAGSNPGGPVQGPPPFTPAPVQPRGQAVRGQVLPADSANFWGRAATMVALPASVNPSITVGPVFRQATQAQAKIPPWSKGRVASSPGSVPAPPPQPGMSAGQPAGIRVIYLATGRCQSTPAAVAPVPPPTQGPVFRQATSPARIRPSLPPRGRTAGNPGIPPAPAPVPAPVYPLHGPVAARRPLPPRGRVATGNPGAPVRNPHTGPVFRQLNWPARTRIPQNAPRGRTGSNPGGPVQNIPFGSPLFRLGSPRFRWDTGIPVMQWEASTPVFQWDTGVPVTSG